MLARKTEHYAMEKIKSKPGLLAFFNRCPDTVKWYFEHVPRLVNEFPLDVAPAYVFSQVEAAQIMTLYCGATKLHSVDKDIARKAISAYHMTRADFRAKFGSMFGKPIPDWTARPAMTAEAVRDRIMHGALGRLNVEVGCQRSFNHRPHRCITRA